MSEIKLEVGKTYRDRNGEEVKIIEKIGKGYWRYRGNNSKWYTESGRWEVFGTEAPQDLIEEVPSESTRHTFKVPDGVKEITLDYFGNRIVVEMVPEEGPKPGDVMIDAKGNVYIFKSVVAGDTHKHFAWFGKDWRLVIGSMCTPGRPATPEEAQPLFDALEKAGKRWNPETMQVEEVPERERIMDFLKGYADGVTWNYVHLCWLIEAYLIHREDKK